MQQLAKYLLLTIIAIAVTVTLSRSHFEGHLWTGNSTFIVDLNRAPVWSPPSPPEYAVFRSTFDDIPASKPPNFEVRRVHRWSWTLIDLALLMIPIGLVSAVVHFSTRRRWGDPVLHFAGWIGIGLFGSAMLCFILYLIVGGWGPPAPGFFAVLGVILGVVSAVITKRRASPNHRLHLTGEGRDHQRSSS